MARGTRTRKTRKQRGGGPFDFLIKALGIPSAEQPPAGQPPSQPVAAVVPQTNTRSWWQKLTGQKAQNTSAVAPAQQSQAAAAPVNLKTGNSPVAVASAPPPSSVTTSPANGQTGGRRKRRTLRKKSKKTRRSRK